MIGDVLFVSDGSGLYLVVEWNDIFEDDILLCTSFRKRT